MQGGWPGGSIPPHPIHRGIAQPGRAPALGAGDRRFESGYPDQRAWRNWQTRPVQTRGMGVRIPRPYLAEWWNWHTRTSEGRVPSGLRVRLPPRPSRMLEWCNWQTQPAQTRRLRVCGFDSHLQHHVAVAQRKSARLWPSRRRFNSDRSPQRPNSVAQSGRAQVT